MTTNVSMQHNDILIAVKISLLAAKATEHIPVDVVRRTASYNASQRHRVTAIRW